MRRGRLGLFAFAVLAFALAACKPPPVEGVFTCDATSNRPRCGTTAEGLPFTCFGGKQLGAGRDFCAEPCATEAAATDDADSICVKNAKLSKCRPSEKTPEDPDGCGKELACLRTDLTRDEGVCLMMQVCSKDEECGGVVPTCGSTILKAMFPKAAYNLTNLQCVVAGCKASQTSCPLGESCLPSVVSLNTPVPDICVPACDSEQNCPPNYQCWRKLSGPASANVCIPTLPGMRCASGLDCWAGECLDTGEGFSLCSMSCERDQDCATISDQSRRSYCVPVKNGKRYCIAVSPLAGSSCLADEHCKAGQKCFRTSPYWPGLTELGECRLPCGSDDSCPTRGGLPHACFIKDADRSCYPGVLGVTCRRSEECLAGRTCESLPPEDGPAVDAGAGADAGPQSRRVCTQPCTTDVDCVDVWANQEGYCAAGWCRLGHQLGSPCTRDEQCAANRCQGASPGSPGTCTRR